MTCGRKMEGMSSELIESYSMEFPMAIISFLNNTALNFTALLLEKQRTITQTKAKGSPRTIDLPHSSNYLERRTLRNIS